MGAHPVLLTVPTRMRLTAGAVVIALVTLVGLAALILCAAFGPMDRAWRTFLGLDRAANALTGGSDKETISSRGGRGQAEGLRRWCVICALIGWVFRDPDHCKNSREDNGNRAD
jgi:hypothetical protein